MLKEYSWKGVFILPEISLFFGIRITINYSYHMPPHFHAEYNGDRALIDIMDVKVLKGMLPKRQLKLVLAWAELHKDELIQNWELSRSHERLNKISPLS
ncbi:DUF4160 domain-containing protein [Clostridium luticellarii]|jgi:hypothetical protein|nr:DUF4160 domain-containing protein [Clostridium luticellarii]MCI1946135.1 DUF4160 domain-containing protein [Clostridium luticellarii]